MVEIISEPVSLSDLCREKNILILDPDINDINFPPVNKIKLGRPLGFMISLDTMSTEHVLEAFKKKKEVNEPGTIFDLISVNIVGEKVEVIALGSPYKREEKIFYPRVTRDTKGRISLDLHAPSSEVWTDGFMFVAALHSKKEVVVCSQ